MPVSKTAGLNSAGLFTVLLMGLPLLAGMAANPWVATAEAFYRSGALVFGGGHVVLPMLQGEPAIAEAVSQDQYLAGYGAAQAVPGPLFTFVAFLGFNMEAGAWAWLSSALALIAVFLPGVLLVVAALPFWAAVQTSPLARSSVAGANAAVVGILAGAPITPVVTSAITGLAPLLIALACLALLMLAKWPAWAVVADRRSDRARSTPHWGVGGRLSNGCVSAAEYTFFEQQEEHGMNTITVELSDEDAALVRKHADFEGVTISDFARPAILDKIEDSCDLQELREAIAEEGNNDCTHD